MKNKCKFRFLLLYMTVPVWLFSQTKNPDISVITDFRAFFHNNQAAPSEKNALNLDLHEMEVAIQGYLNPPDSKEDKYWGAGVFAGFAPMEDSFIKSNVSNKIETSKNKLLFQE